jgi:ABC-type nickel/cobalt efflux system permease component RcnA
MLSQPFFWCIRRFFTFTHTEFAATEFTLNFFSVKFFLKFLLSVMLLQTGWFPVAAHSGHIHDTSAVASAEDVHRSDKLVSLSEHDHDHDHDHDCETCLQQCHPSSAILDKPIVSQRLADAGCLISLDQWPIGCAPPSKIERPKWMATTA